MDIGGGTAAGVQTRYRRKYTTGNGRHVVLNGSSQLSAAQAGSIQHGVGDQRH